MDVLLVDGYNHKPGWAFMAAFEPATFNTLSSHNHGFVESTPQMKGNQYWRYTHFPLNHGYGRKGTLRKISGPLEEKKSSEPNQCFQVLFVNLLGCKLKFVKECACWNRNPFCLFFSFANGASSPSKQKNGWLESLSIFVLGHDITSSYLELIRIWTVFSHIWKTPINPPRLAANKRSPTISQMIQSDLFGMVSLRDLLKGFYICDLQRSGIKLGHELNPHLDI